MFDGTFTTEPEFRYPGLWDGRVGSWFPGLGCQGNNLFDWSTTGAKGTLAGSNAAVGWQLSQGLTAFQANGTSDYFDCGTAVSSTLSGTARASISLWVYSPTSNTNWYFGVTQTSSRRFEMSQFNNAMGLSAENGSTSFRTVSNSATGWNHYVGTFSSGLITLYLNGKAVSSGGTSPATLGTTGGCYIGTDLSLTRYSTAGALYDDLAIFNRVLSADEVLLLYGNGAGRGIAYTPADSMLFPLMPISMGRLLTLRRREMCL